MHWQDHLADGDDEDYTAAVERLRTAAYASGESVTYEEYLIRAARTAHLQCEKAEVIHSREFNILSDS